MPETLEEEGPVESSITPWKLVEKLAKIIGDENFPPGDRATLRRMTPGMDPPLKFYRVFYRIIGVDEEYRLGKWMAICAGMAIMSPHPHNRKIKTGKALAKAGYSELRLERLLAAKGKTKERLLLNAARFLAAKRIAVNWVTFALLLLVRSDEKYEKAKRGIARDYYLNKND